MQNQKIEHVCQPLCNVAAVVVVFNVSVIWVSINTLLPCCSQQNFFVYSWINTNENLKNPKKPVLCTDFIPRHHDLPILPTQDHLLRRQNIEPSNFWSNGIKWFDTKHPSHEKYPCRNIRPTS
jgi:hypothetical protein